MHGLIWFIKLGKQHLFDLYSQCLKKPGSSVANFYSELRRRRVFATISIYVVAAWLLIQVADVLFPGWNIAEENIRYLFYISIGCFPIAFIIGWKYDITPRGIKRTPPASQSPTDVSLPLNRADHLLLSFLSIVFISIVVGFTWKIKVSPVFEMDSVLPNSVAVLPFSDHSEEADNEYFATGLWHEMINVMGQIDGFRVTPAPSAGYFKDRDLDLGEIKKKLLVANVIIGSVQKAANRVRITLSLNDTAEGTNLWSQTYDRDLEDIFAIQSDIANAVAEVMKVQILGQEKARLESPPTGNIEAYDMLMLAGEAEGFKRAIALTERAIELDPSYVDAHIQRALLAMRSFYMPGGGGVEAALELCNKTLKTVRELQPNAADVSFSYNWINGICLRRTLWLARGNSDMEREMEAAFKKAVELNPSESLPHISYAIYLRRENRIREAEDQIRQALELDRLNRGAMLHLSRVLSIQGKDKESIEWSTRVTEYFENGYGVLALRHADLGHYDLAIETLLQAPQMDEQIYGVAYTIRELLFKLFELLRDPEAAKKYKKGEVEAKLSQPAANNTAAALTHAWDLAARGNYDEAYNIAVAATDKANIKVWYMLNEPAELAVLAERYNEAISIYERALPNLIDPIRPDVKKTQINEALLLAHALQMSGNTSRAAVLFGRILDVIEGRRRLGQENIGIIDVYVYASLGDTERAIIAMREAVSLGWRELYGGMLNQPHVMLSSLAGIPEYEALVDEINADLALQLRHVKSMGF